MAKALAALERHDEAESVARAAVDTALATDWLIAQAHAMADLASVLPPPERTTRLAAPWDTVGVEMIRRRLAGARLPSPWPGSEPAAAALLAFLDLPD